jgi:hypothetical protein
MRTLTVALVMTLGVMVTSRASAECQDDIASLQAKVAAQQSLRGQQSLGETSTTDSATRTGYATAKAWIAKAIEVEPMSEIECLNDLARARKALAAAAQASPADQKEEAPPRAPVQSGLGRLNAGASSPTD